MSRHLRNLRRLAKLRERLPRKGPRVVLGLLEVADLRSKIAVTAADPGGLWGAVKESAAVAGALREAGGGNALIAEIVAAYETSEGREPARGVLRAEARGKAPAAVVEAAVAELGAVAALVASKAPEAARASTTG